MSAYDNTNSGALFKNDKQGNDDWPDYRGQINVNGEDFWISAWLKTSKKDGTKYMSLAVQPNDKKQSSQSSRQPARQPSRQPDRQPPRQHRAPDPQPYDVDDQFNDDLPF
jgi:hypothetical protein